MFTSAGLIESLRQYRLLDPPQLDEAKPLAASLTDPRALTSELTRRGWLTAFQVRMLAQGRGPQLVIGPYVILEKLGEGGMGAVYKARNTRLGRLVAIKLLRKERNSNPELIQRFHREVQVASSLSHPNVVRAYDAIEVEGSLIFEMEYIEGINLTQLVHKRGPLPIPMACDFIRQAALGLQHAHEKGLVHRDIKPSNLVVTRSLNSSSNGEQSPHGLVKLLDMGLALIATPEGQQEKTRLTQLGKVVGTTDFLAPEQARNSHGVDIRADLYSLGCTFYFLLVGRVPFPEGAPMEKLLKHQLDEPEAVEKVRPELPSELAAVVHKLMAKKPAERYQSPAEVAVVLEPLVGPTTKSKAVPPVLPPRAVAVPVPSPPPIPVFPPGKAAAVAPAIAAVAVLEPPALPSAAVTASATATLPMPAEPDPVVQTDSGSDPFLQMASSAPTRAVGRKHRVILGLLLLALAGGLGFGLYQALRRDASSGQNKPDPDAEKRPLPKDVGPWSLDRLSKERIPEAERLPGQPSELVAVVGEHRQRHWGAVACIAYSANGKRVASAGYEGFIRVWDAETAKEQGVLIDQLGRVFAVAFLSDKQLLSVHQIGTGVQLLWWNLDTMSNIKAIELGKGARPLTAATIWPDEEGGASVALAVMKREGTDLVGEVSVVSLGSETNEEHLLPAGKTIVTHLAWSPNGKTLAGASGKAIKLWDVNATKEIATLPGHDYPVAGLAFVRGGQALASCSSYSKALAFLGEIKLWDLSPAAIPAAPAIPVQGHMVSLTADPNGELLAWGTVKAGGTYSATVWDVAEKKEHAVLAPLETRPMAVAFAPTGKTLLTAGEDQALRFWDLSAGKEHSAVPAFRGRIAAPVLSPDGQYLAYLAGAGEQSVTVCDFATGKEKVFARLKIFALTLSFVGDGKTLAGCGTNSVTFWETATGKELSTFKAPADAVLVGPVSPDGHSVLVAAKDASVKLWDPLTGKERVPLNDAAKPVNGVAAYSPDSKFVAAAVPGQPALRLFNTATGEEKSSFGGLSGVIVGIAFSADGSRIAAVARDGGVRIWEVAQPLKNPIRALSGPATTSLAFSANGAHLAVWGTRTLTLVEVATGKGKTLLNAPDLVPGAIAFAPTGQTLAFVNGAGRLFLVNPATPEEAKAQVIKLPGPVQALTFSADGRHLVTANGNGTLYVLRLEAPGK